MNRIRVCFTGCGNIREEDCGEVAHALCGIVKNLLKNYNFPQFLFTGEGQFERVANEFIKGVAQDFPHRNIKRILVADVRDSNAAAKDYDGIIYPPYSPAEVCDLVVAYGAGIKNELIENVKRLYKPVIYI